jgi:hypothetical protein
MVGFLRQALLLNFMLLEGRPGRERNGQPHLNDAVVRRVADVWNIASAPCDVRSAVRQAEKASAFAPTAVRLWFDPSQTCIRSSVPAPARDPNALRAKDVT